jgi:hypothetical protein
LLFVFDRESLCARSCGYIRRLEGEVHRERSRGDRLPCDGRFGVAVL